MTTASLIPRLPLRVQLILMTALIATCTLFAGGLVIYRVVEADLLSDIDARLAIDARQMSEFILRDAPAERTAGEVSVPEGAVAPGIVAKVIMPDGRSHMLAARLPVATVPDDLGLIAAARGGQVARTTVRILPDESVRLLAMPLQSGQPAAGILIVGESLRGTYDILATLRGVLLLVGILVVVLVTGGAALVMAPPLTAISTLTHLTAEVVASENYRQRVALPVQRDEVYQLSATINDLISRVQRTLDHQRQFLAFTSHELRSPLTVILANLDLLRRDMTAEERALSVAEAAEEARRMRRLVNDLLLLAEQDSTRVVARTPMRLDSLIEETVASSMRQDVTHRVHVSIDGPVVVEGDAERLMQVVRNLVENALNHTPPGTEVDVRLAQMNGYAEISVSDNGPGIGPEHLPYLWDRFYRVDKSRSRVVGSTGLGLPIVRYLAEAHGGSVAISSTPGVGTTFTVTLPLHV